MWIDVVITLGFQNDKEGKLSPGSVARAKGAFRLYSQHPGLKLLLTGGYGQFNVTAKPHAYYVARLLISWGVNENDILEFVESAHTVEDAFLCKQMLEPYDVRSIIVVTSDFHLERTRLVFSHFFAPSILSFVGTPNCVGRERLLTLIEHEARAINVIEEQGGIVYFPPAPNQSK